MSDPDIRSKHFPHLRSVFVATHSSLFLSRTDLGANFVVRKNGTAVALHQLQTFSEFNQLHFNLLGNDLGSLFLPEAIVVLEGKTDCNYARAIFGVLAPAARIGFVDAEGDGGVTNKLNTIISVVGELATSPYRDRIHVLLDQRNSTKQQQLVNRGLASQQIQVLEKNGIEHYYPVDILGNIFGCSSERVLADLVVKAEVSCSGLCFSKSQLNREVLNRISADVNIPEELREKLIHPVLAMLGL